MTIEQFLKTYKFSFDAQIVGGTTYLMITRVFRREDNKLMDSVRTYNDVYETNNWITDSQTMVSLNEWDLESFVEEIKRFQLDYFARRVPIEDVYPLNRETDISEFYT